MHHVLDIHVLNDLSKVVLVHLIFIDDDLISSILEAEDEVELVVRLSVPGAWSKALYITGRSHFHAF